jgi:hypothetical protein
MIRSLIIGFLQAEDPGRPEAWISSNLKNLITRESNGVTLSQRPKA